MARRHILSERIEWLESFPPRMTIGALLKALRIVNRSTVNQGSRQTVNTQGSEK